MQSHSRQTENFGPTHLPRSLPADFLFSPPPNKAAKRFHVKLLCGFFYLYTTSVLPPDRGRRTVACARAMQEAKFTTRKEGSNNVGLPQSHPPAQREARGLLGARSLERTLEEKPVARLFGPVWGFLLQAKPVSPLASGPRIVWSGSHTARAFCGRGIPAGAVRSGLARGLRRAYAEAYSTW